MPLVAVVLFTALLVTLFVNFGSEDPRRLPNRYILPEGFTGNIKIIYQVEGAPPLPLVDEHHIHEIPRSGILQTSSRPEYGFAVDEFLRRSADGGHERLNVQWLKRRINGLLGDRNEFFNSPKELVERDRLFAEEGHVDAEGNNILRNPYEIIVIRDDFDPTPAE
jgi:hypothetical protein